MPRLTKVKSNTNNILQVQGISNGIVGWDS